MKKIPLAPADKSAQDPLPPAPTAVPEALEILLLGGIWWSVLILLPLLQQPQMPFDAEARILLFKVQGLATVAIALVLLVLRVVAQGRQWREHLRALLLLAGIAAAGVVLVWQAQVNLAAGNLHHYAAALQAILALAYFLTRRQGQTTH